jgi:hypothetical protein
MHAEAYEAVGGMVKESGHDFADLEPSTLWFGLDVGGRDVNGTARDWFPTTLWQGLDIRPGPGVDIVADATVWTADEDTRAYDFVLSTECLEHVEHWRGIIRAAASALHENGPQLAFFTAASTGRGAHGASGEHTPPPGEWYGNVTQGELATELDKYFEFTSVRYNPNPGDVYAWARGVR